MGLGAVQSAFQECYRLGDKHAAARLLLHMAFHVTDDPRGDKPALTFYAGWKTAAQGLGYSLLELERPERAAAAQAALKRALRVLEAAGLITKLRRSAPGRTVEWRLTLQPVEAVEKSRPRSNRGVRRPSGTGDEDRRDSDEDRPVHGAVTVRNRGRSSSPPSVRPDSSVSPVPSGRARARATPSKTDLEMEAS